MSKERTRCRSTARPVGHYLIHLFFPAVIALYLMGLILYMIVLAFLHKW